MRLRLTARETRRRSIARSIVRPVCTMKSVSQRSIFMVLTGQVASRLRGGPAAIGQVANGTDPGAMGRFIGRPSHPETGAAVSSLPQESP